MAITPGECGYQNTTDSTGGYLFQEGGRGASPLEMRAVRIKCDSASAQSLLVSVEGVHAAGTFDRLDVGEERTYTATRGGTRGGIRSVWAKSVTGTVTFSWSKVA